VALFNFSMAFAKIATVYFEPWYYLQLVLAMVISWLVCLVLTEYDVLPNDPSHPSYKTRTDARAGVIEKMSWFYFPYPGNCA
jgi:hypothetical protein